MNLRTKLESKEGCWVKIHFPDASSLTGILQHVGIDFVQIECYGKDDMGTQEQNAHSQHLIPLSLIKMFTIEANTFIEAERCRLEYISQKTYISQDDFS